MAVPIGQLSAQSHKQFLEYYPKGGQNTVAAMGMLIKYTKTQIGIEKCLILWVFLSKPLMAILTSQLSAK